MNICILSDSEQRSAFAQALGGSGAPAASDPAALRAARLAALEKRA